MSLVLCFRIFGGEVDALPFCCHNNRFPSDPNAVLDSKFRVRGVTGLRVVDASVFPKIPGFYVALPIYMISEKAADVIINNL